MFSPWPTIFGFGRRRNPKAEALSFNFRIQESTLDLLFQKYVKTDPAGISFINCTKEDQALSFDIVAATQRQNRDARGNSCMEAFFASVASVQDLLYNNFPSDRVNFSLRKTTSFRCVTQKRNVSLMPDQHSCFGFSFSKACRRLRLQQAKQGTAPKHPALAYTFWISGLESQVRSCCTPSSCGVHGFRGLAFRGWIYGLSMPPGPPWAHLSFSVLGCFRLGLRITSALMRSFGSFRVWGVWVTFASRFLKDEPTWLCVCI